MAEGERGLVTGGERHHIGTVIRTEEEPTKVQPCTVCGRPVQVSLYHPNGLVRCGARCKPGHPAPDGLGQLRGWLAEARQAGIPFEEAWPKAQAAAVADCGRMDAIDWTRAFELTEGAWREAYAGRPLTAGYSLGALRP